MRGLSLRIPASSAFLVLSLYALTALAQNAPGDAEITLALRADLPAYWSVESVDIRASVNDGDEVTPRYRQRFVANVVPNEDLYALAPGGQAMGPFKLLVTTRTTTEAYKLYGIASSGLALGDWVTEVALENPVETLGRPASLFSVPVVVAGSKDVERVAAHLMATQELTKTVVEALARANASTEALSQLAAQEREALETANQQRLGALRAQYDQETATIKAAAERERAALEEMNRKLLEKLKKKLNEESSAIEAIAETAAQERNRLIEENRRSLEALKAQYEEKRAAAMAAAETLQYVAKAKAEVAALEELSTVQDILARTRQRVAKQQQELVSAQTAERKKRYEELSQVLRSEDASARNAAWDAVLSSDDTRLKAAALDAIMASSDEPLKATAMREAMTSGDSELQSRAMAAWISQKPSISVSVQSDDSSGIMIFSITSVKKDLTFSGSFRNMAWRSNNNKDVKDNGSGFVSGRQLTLSGDFLGYGDRKFNCSTKLKLDDDAKLTGKTHCGEEAYTSEIDFWSK